MGASYGVTVQYAGGAGGGVLHVVSALDPVRAPRAAAAVLRELKSLRADAATMAEDFARARRRTVGELLASSTDATTVAGELEWMVGHDASVEQLRGFAAEVARLTPAEVARVAAADLDPARMVVSVDGREERVTPTLAELGATDIKWFDE
jgi:zinc protease